MFLTLVNVKRIFFKAQTEQQDITWNGKTILHSRAKELLFLSSENDSYFNFIKQKRCWQWKNMNKNLPLSPWQQSQKGIQKQTNMVTHSPKWNFTIRGRTPALVAFTMPWTIAFSPPYLTTSLYRQVGVTFIYWIKRVQSFTCVWNTSSSVTYKVKKTVTLSLKGYFREGVMSNREFT